MAKRKIHSSTQDFTEVVDIVDDIVLLKGKNACSILDVSSVNFFLLSADEQNARIYGYMSLLNSLSFPIQILIVSKRIDLSSYLTLVDRRIKNVQKDQVREHLKLYREFIQELIKGGRLLDKKIYVVVPFSYLELGAATATTTSLKKHSDPITRIKELIITKRASIITQIERIGLSARPLSSEELTKLFYEVLNGETITLDFDPSDVKNIIL